ncbi:pentatricopeptide repeat-containing protein At4g04790, mitochondrial isoform X2 [Vigna radiata var. radiata]|uniref:Pentatricopeptide repeat-containing protein At4g04790, mitochondrial isoform X2 n=1 Tax=Vigna radiata var. radiata TaxID=3916 RepID=A0A3Q0EW64_VIGRR|nr:pentatricopeptide repeat-containing protein At4g04790, mitochondrial isoform X2 [Vigna radiata var. radiata]
MRAPAGRNLCTLAEIVRSRLIRKPNTSVESFIAPSPEFEVGFGSELKHSFEHDLAGDLVGKDESTRQISALLCSKQDKGSGYKEVDQEEKRKSALDIPWMADLSHSNLSVKRKEVMRERKHKWIFKYSCNDRFNRLIKLCAHRLGATKTVNVFSHLGRKTGVKEYNALIKVCIEKARATDDEYIAVNEMSKAFHLFKSMRDFGCPLEEQTYGPLLCYLIDMGLVQEFQLFSDVIKAENPRSASRLGYYEMLLWLRVDNEEMIRDICEFIIVDDRDSDLRASYLMALCESDKTMQLLDVVKNVDIIKLLSAECIVNIFRSLGRLQQQSVADDILLDLRTRDYDEDNISNFIVSYAVSIPNLAVEDIMAKVNNLHELLEVLLSSSSYEKLILHCCGLDQVGDALDIVEQMCDAGFNLSTDVLQFILQICEESFEYIWVHRIHSIICRYHLELNGEICRCLVHFCVRIKDKNINAGLRVLKHMQGANVDPDSQTFSYLINNCETEEDIVKYCDEMKQSGIQPTKQVFMALVHSYAACGNLEKAKQVVLDPHIPGKSLNEIKSVLVGNLVSHGQLSEALLVYEQIKKDGHKLEPKAIKCLIEELTQHNGELDALLLLLNEMSDLDYWVDGCFKVILYCARNNDLSSAMLLLKQLKDKFENDEMVLEALFDGVFSAIAASEATHLQIGLDLLWAIKDELGLRPSRQCLDFLLSACANAGDLNNARLIWREYEIAGFPYNVLSYLRMYQTLLAAGDGRSASFILKKIPRDDAEVCAVIMACEETYSALNSVGEKKEQLKRKGRKSKRKKT